MGKRNELILNIIIKEHIKTGAPVGSSLLVDKYKLGISPATVRNEMAELEEEVRQLDQVRQQLYLLAGVPESEIETNVRASERSRC